MFKFILKLTLFTPPIFWLYYIPRKSCSPSGDAATLFEWVVLLALIAAPLYLLKKVPIKYD